MTPRARQSRSVDADRARQPRLTAAPSRASACLRSSSAMSGKLAASRATAAGSLVLTGLRVPRRSGAWRNAMRAMARQPRNWLTCSQITLVECWISIAAGPSTRSTKVPGSRSSPSTGRCHWILIGWLCAAMSAPTISVQRVTSSAEAKPCFLKVSPMALPTRSRNGLAKEREGLFMMRGSVIPRPEPMIATVAGKPMARQRGKRRTPESCPQPTALLAWYDRHRRKLPWRAPPGERADPYRVWLSEIMLQQTTVKAVAPYYGRFLQRWDDVGALAAAPLDDVLKAWAGLGYYARARNLHACSRAVVERHGGKFPVSEAELRALPGIGDYTAAAIVAIAYDLPATPVDGNVERVVARLYAVETPLPAAKPEIRRLAGGLTPQSRAGDFAQAMMDLGSTICTPKNPACALCPWNDACAAYARGEAETLPLRTPKREGTLRRGAAFVARRADGMVLLRTRPAKGLLGAMTEVPTTQWRHDFDEGEAREGAPRFASTKMQKRIAWRKVAGVVRHVFTHFPLELSVYTADVPARTPAPAGTRWVALASLAGEALPSVMRKVVAHALP